MGGEALYFSGGVTWVVKTPSAVYGEVLGDYSYRVKIDLSTGSSFCTCPKGGSCEHVDAVKIALERGFYFECNTDVFPEACALSMMEEVPALALEYSIKMLRYELQTDESGSKAAYFFMLSLNLERKLRDPRKLPVLQELLDEYARLFPDYPLTERLKSEFRLLKSELTKARE
ncbi:SWIM zinc finger family protein [Thermococcus waiotapuensis]|uniref:SWIM zinc finger family protein n=1 Tax=Thermococcus waiotapuensis TaxID=90909 RepID=A0AAE4NT85_9EURY|nr:SWIM zinc finger family protein [Thermococcus waiotapuensis]MDV3103210.1 SWIM zinc finger family protein [Thermococcus waiotapuensis]